MTPRPAKIGGLAPPGVHPDADLGIGLRVYALDGTPANVAAREHHEAIQTIAAALRDAIDAAEYGAER